MLCLKKMMTLLFIFCSAKNILAQEKMWRVGIHAGTGYYQLYNKNDWNADPVLIYPIKSQSTNWTVGATTTYAWGKHWGLSSGLLLSKNRQEFQEAKDPDILVPDPKQFYSITNEFNYLKLPVSFQFSSNNESKHQFRASIGLQTSFLLSYREHFLQTSTGFRSEFETRNKFKTAIATGTNQNYDRFWYKRWLLGSVAELAYNFQTKDYWLFSIGIRGEYDVSNAENHKAKLVENGQLFWQSGIKRYGYGNIADRPKTHNRSWGLFISTSLPVSGQ